MLEHGGEVRVAPSLAQTARKEMSDVPSSADTLGWADWHQGVHSSAIGTLREAVNENPDDRTLRYRLGIAPAGT